jgi:hypothetical protein
MPDTLARATSALEERQGTLRQIGQQLLEGFEEFEHAQDPQQHDKVSAVSSFDTLYRAFRDAGFFSQSGLGQSGFDSATLEAVTNFVQYRCVGQLRYDSHNSSL